MEIKKVLNVESGPSKGVQVFFVDDNGKERGQIFQGDGWLEKDESGEEKFLTRLKADMEQESKTMQEILAEIQATTVTELTSFSGKKVELKKDLNTKKNTIGVV